MADRTALGFRPLPRSELGRLSTLVFDSDQVERFLGPLGDIQAAVQRGPAHSATAIEADGALAGFYVIHPDLRDGACWWLGWLALERRLQGRGHGRPVLQSALDRLRRIVGCREVRLLVAADNHGACRLYDRAGFRRVGRLDATGELILELALRAVPGAADAGRFLLATVAARARRVFRHRRLRLSAGPHAAWVIGVERGPPSARAVAAG